MITLYGFGRVHKLVRGETRDLRVQWALEEIGMPYRVRALDHTGGELHSPEYSQINCFLLIPAIDDDGFVVTESAAAVLYLAEKSGTLIPTDFQGRTRVVQWSFAALSTVERPLLEIQLLDKFGGGEVGAKERRAAMVEEAGRWLSGLERRLDGREWIACADFTVADILLATVLREVRKTNLLEPYPRLTDYYSRAFGRPAWKRTLADYAKRVDIAVEDIG